MHPVILGNLMANSALSSTWFQDLFTGDNDDQLVSAHTPDIVDGMAGTGNPWESGGTTWTIQGNAANNNPGVETSLWDADAAVFTSGTYSWIAQGSNTIANVDNTLEITYVDSSTGAYVLLTDTADLSADLSIGEIYKIKVDKRMNGGIGSLGWGNGGTPTTAPKEGSSFNNTSFDSTEINIFPYIGTYDPFLMFRGLGAGEVGYIDNISIGLITPAELFATDDLEISEGIFDVNITIPTNEGNIAGLVICLDSESNPQNYIEIFYYKDRPGIFVVKCVAGAKTILINDYEIYSVGAKLRAIVSDHVAGTSLKVKVYYNDALIGTEQTITDVGIVDNTRHGIMSTDSANSLDDFTVTV